MFTYYQSSVLLLIAFGCLFQSCTPPILKTDVIIKDTPVDPIITIHEIKPEITPPTIEMNEDSTAFTVLIEKYVEPRNIISIDSVVKAIPHSFIKSKIFHSVKDDSLTYAIYEIVLDFIPENISFYILDSTLFDSSSTTLMYSLNKSMINLIIFPYLEKYGYPEQNIIYPLFNKGGTPPGLDVFSNLKLILPCENIPVPKRALLLPNAPRSYRHGIHRGIDFYVNWGSPVRAVAHGTVLRADHNFEEVSPDFRLQVLAEAKRLGHTPSDVFEHILVGQAVYIDHGFNLVPGYRTFSIYAHLSHIDGHIKPGTQVSAGQRIGLSGNSGTKDSTLGSRKGAHLHWELILQDAGGEYYLGQGWSYDDLFERLINIFISN